MLFVYLVITVILLLLHERMAGVLEHRLEDLVVRKVLVVEDFVAGLRGHGGLRSYGLRGTYLILVVSHSLL